MKLFGGREEIRTPEGFDTLRAFQARALDRYATLPRHFFKYLRIFISALQLAVHGFVGPCRLAPAARRTSPRPLSLAKQETKQSGLRMLLQNCVDDRSAKLYSAQVLEKIENFSSWNLWILTLSYTIFNWAETSLSPLLDDLA